MGVGVQKAEEQEEGKGYEATEDNESTRWGIDSDASLWKERV